MAGVGFNFRNTAGFVADPVGTAGVLPTDAYPTTKTIGGQSVTYGWVQVTIGGGRDRNAVVDPRLAGTQQEDNTSGKSLFRIDLAPGSYNFSAAFGEASFDANQWIWALDGGGRGVGTQLFAFATGQVIPAGSFLDATGVVRTAANWPSANASAAITLSSSFFLEMGHGAGSTGNTKIAHMSFEMVGTDYTQRKGSTFTATHTLGTITTATLNAAAITINTTGAGTVNLTDTSGITTSGAYNLILGDGAATETYTVQLNVYGVVPSNNPAQKDGAALASLTNVQVRITSGTGLNGVQRFYSPTETTDASGNFSTLDLSSSVAADADPVLMHVLTAAGDSIISPETVGLI
jgi:hypothetical protein